MRVLLNQRPGGAYAYISDAWQNAFRSVGVVCERWDGTQNTWQSFAPSLYIGASGHKQPIPDHRNSCKVAIHCNPYGDVDIHGINESQVDIKWVLDQHPDVVFGYGFKDDAHFWSKWTVNYGIPWVPMPTAADITLFNITNRPKLYDIVYIGGYWSYKSSSIDKWLLPVIRENSNYCLYGWGKWPAGVKHLGIVKDEDVPNLLASAKVGPCISEPHTGLYGIDIPERIWKIVMCGALAIHDNIPRLIDRIPSLIMAENVEHFRLLCSYYIKADQTVIDEWCRRQRHDVLTAHTYHHRLSGLLFALGFDNVAISMNDYIDNVSINSVNI